MLAAAQTFLSDGNPLDPIASPVLSDYTDITTPIYVQVGGDEALHDQALEVVERARRGGVDATVEVFPGMQHVFEQGAGRIPASDEALRKIADFLRPLLKLDDDVKKRGHIQRFICPARQYGTSQWFHNADKQGTSQVKSSAAVCG
jgi:acetyl esterase/lipase